MSLRPALLLLMMIPCQVSAAPLILEGEVPDDGQNFLLVPFDVPAGTEEIEIRHDDLSEANILDFGVFDPASVFRGWGGGNTEPAVLNATAASRSYLPGPLRPGSWTVLIGKARIVERPARYRLEIELRSSPTLPPHPGRATYAPAPPLSTEARWYAGDLHVHSRESGDAKPAIDEVASFARSRGLDFVAITDHNTTSHLGLLPDAQTRHPSLLLIPGMEFTTYAGHANALGVRDWVDFRVGQGGVTIDGAIGGFREQGALFSINHPVLDLGDACIGCAWKHTFDRSMIHGVEIATGGWSQSGVLFTEKAIAWWDALCARGHHLAALGGSDDHRAGEDPGGFHSPVGDPTTMVYADGLSEPAILEAIRSGRTVVKLQGPSDPMVEITAGSARIGDTVRLPEAVLRATVTGGKGHALVWVHDGVREPPIPITEDPFVHPLSVPAPEQGESRWRAEVWVDGKPRTVTSHLWIAPPAPAAPEGCTCTSAPMALLGAIGSLALLGRRRGRRRTEAR